MLAFDIGVIEDVVATHSKQEIFWHKLLGDQMVPVVVQGFPTARRPESCPGLELPFGLLLEAVGASTTTASRGFHFLKGSRIHLKMVKRLHNTFYWHEIYDTTGSSHRTSYSLGRRPSCVNPAAISMAELETGRHIVCGDKLTSSYITDSECPHIISFLYRP